MFGMAYDYNSEERKLERAVNIRMIIKSFAGTGLIILLTVIIWWYQNLQPPVQFPVEVPFVVREGMSIEQIFTAAEDEGYIRSKSLLYVLLYLSGDANRANIQAGSYRFETPLPADELLEQLLAGDTDLNLVRITIPEGTRASEIATIAATQLTDFDTAAFTEAGEAKEGYLFPETYLVPPEFTAEELLELLVSTYNEQLSSLQKAISEHPLSEYEVLVLASIIEREANNVESMRTVSGILQNRLEIGMPLQADASVEYVLDKPLSELTPNDLRIDSPYNTYTNTGLPPTPIGNPGLQAILAVLEPAESKYFYYITGNDGRFYYSETYAEHQRNIERYLR